MISRIIVYYSNTNVLDNILYEITELNNRVENSIT